MATKILTAEQAEAVYSAMCALNNVGGLLSAHIRSDTGDFIDVYQDSSAVVSVVYVHDQERYEDQSAFAAAYGLSVGGQQ